MLGRAAISALRSSKSGSAILTVSRRAFAPSVARGGLLGVALAAGYMYHQQQDFMAAGNRTQTKLASLFESHATATGPNGEKRMTEEDILQLMGPSSTSLTARALCGLISRSGAKSLSLEEFIELCEIMQRPDAEHFLAFKLADKERTGFITKSEFKDAVMLNHEAAEKVDWSSEWISLFFGKEGEGHLSYLEFSQLLEGMQHEHVRQDFVNSFDEVTGLVSADRFLEILENARVALPPGMSPERVRELARVTDPRDQRGEGISYAQFDALSNLLQHLPAYAHVISGAIKNTGKAQIGKAEFLREAHRQSLPISPMECHLAFFFFDTNKDGALDHEELSTAVELAELAVAQNPVSRSPIAPAPVVTSMASQALDGVFHFGLGAIAGGIGATAVYPIDLVKTRMQNQRTAKGSTERLYKHSFDCFAKTVRNEGFVGLYRGIGPQLVGVAPEKAIKLTMNDLLRKTFSKEDGSIPFALEMVAGGGAGASQVIFTNPLEIVKIRLQVQGEAIKRGLMTAAEKQSAIAIVRELGLGGLYKGASACLMRDIPFSAIYFPTYAKMKRHFSNADGTPSSAGHLLLAGAIAGVPAAGLVTPADVIKTRLQVKYKTGEAQHKGIVDCTKTILREEGFSALWKGAIARVFRSSPQFGVTLVSYELLQRLFGISTDSPPKSLNVPVTSAEIKVLHGSNSKMTAVEKKWFDVYSK